MSKDNQVLVRVNDPTDEAIQEFAEAYDFTKAEAVRRMVEDRLTGEGYLDQPTGKAVPDGGAIEEKLDRNHEQIERVESETDQMINYGAILAISLIWIGFNIVIDLPNWFVISSGIALLIALIFPLVSARRMMKNE